MKVQINPALRCDMTPGCAEVEGPEFSLEVGVERTSVHAMVTAGSLASSSMDSASGLSTMPPAMGHNWISLQGHAWLP